MIGNRQAANEKREQEIVDQSVRRTLERAAAQRAEAKDYGCFLHGPHGQVTRVTCEPTVRSFQGHLVRFPAGLSDQALDNFIARTERYYGKEDK